MSDVKIKSGYARHKGVTAKEMKAILNNLIRQGHGDKELCFGFDSNCVYTATDGYFDIDKDTIWFKEQGY